MKLPSIHPLINAIDKFSHKPALLSGHHSFIYLDLYEKTQVIISGLRGRGLQSGDLVILDKLSSEEMIFMLWACSLGGFIAFPLNTRFPESTLIALIQDINSQLIVSQRKLIPELSVTYSDLQMTGSKIPSAEQNEFDLDAATTLLMTSGSAGSSKIVQHSHRNHLSSALGSNLNIPLEPDDRWLLTLPIYHVGGLSLLFRVALSGATVVVPDLQDSLLECISDQRITHVSLVATQFKRMLDDPRAIEILGGMKAILLGGSAFPTSLIKSALENDLPILSSYGSTEMASQITTTTAVNRSAALTNSGKLLEGRDLIISHEGEILVKGDTLAQGYLYGANLTDLRDAKGWFHTGDVGYLNVHGELTVTGRMDNQFISGGENIQPEHIETILMTIRGISQALVLPQSDPEFGTRPVAYVQMDASTFWVEEIVNQLRSSLPGFMIPVAFFHLPQELIADRMKISRHELSEYLHDTNKHLHSLK